MWTIHLEIHRCPSYHAMATASITAKRLATGLKFKIEKILYEEDQYVKEKRMLNDT